MGLRRSFLVLAMARPMIFVQYANAATTSPVIVRRPKKSSSSSDSRLRQAMARSSSNQQAAPPWAQSRASPSPPSRPSTDSSLHLRNRHRTRALSPLRRDWRQRGVPRRTGQGEEGFVRSLPFPSPAFLDRGAVTGIRDRIGEMRRAADGQVGTHRGVVTMAQPRKKMPERSVDVFCQKCRTQLYKYKKGGKGSLVKCYKERIVEDFTDGKLECPSCGQLFARDTMVHGRPAFKMIGGKVYQKK